jgi:CDP-4-dehydro-6-deoxyglucose reductase
MPIVKLCNGTEFESNSNSPILDEAAKSKIIFPYSCKTGRCSSCKCRVLSGNTLALFQETGLSEQEKTEGWILSCVRAAETDVTLEIDDLGGFVLPPVKTLPCRITQIELLTTDIVQVKLRLPPTADFNYIPGQYIDVIGPNVICRSYSLANSPLGDRVLELHIRAVDCGAMSNYWFNQAKPNDLLRINGPLGTFFLRETTGIDLIFLATGTGIAPVKAILESLSQCQPNQRPNSITVLWGCRRLQDFYLNLDGINCDFSFIPVLSQPAADWTGAKGYVQDVLLSKKPNLTNAVVYACGSAYMIHSSKTQLMYAGLKSKNFYSDAFVSSGSN